MEILFVISDLNYKGDIKSFLKVFIEDEGEHVAKMEGFRGGASAGIKVKRREVWISIYMIVKVTSFFNRR